MTTTSLIIIVILIIIIIVIITILSFMFFYFKKNNNPVINKENNEIENIFKTITEIVASKTDKIDLSIEKFKENVINYNNTAIERFTEIKAKYKNQQEFDHETRKKLDDIIKEDIKNVDKLDNIYKNMDKISNAQNDIKQIFYSNKKVGTFAEYSVENMLELILGKSCDGSIWEKQKTVPLYKIDKKGNDIDEKKGIADFVINTPNNKKILIDSKFPYETFQIIAKSDKNNIPANEIKRFHDSINRKLNDLTKYVNKNDALSSIIMYLPSEKMFYYILSNEFDLLNKGWKTKIWIASPSTLPVLLIILKDLYNDYLIQENSKDIYLAIKKFKDKYNDFIDKKWTKLESNWKKLGSSFQDVSKGIEKINELYNDIKKLSIKLDNDDENT